MEGYDAADMAAFLDRAIHSAARRTLSAAPPVALGDREAGRGGADRGGPPPEQRRAVVRLCGEDVAAARRGFSPAAFWGVGKPPDPSAGIKARAPQSSCMIVCHFTHRACHRACHCACRRACHRPVTVPVTVPVTARRPCTRTRF